MKPLISRLFILFALFTGGIVPTLAQTCAEQAVRTEVHSIYAPELHTELQFTVYIPPCMDDRTVHGYPVLYLLHGQDMGMEVWDEIRLAEQMGEGLRQGMPLFYVVTPQEDKYLEALSISGFGDTLLSSLIPWVDSNYHSCTERECRAIGGISRGALWAQRLAFENPDLFGILGLHSMPGQPFSDMELYYLLQKQTENQQIRVRLDNGTLDGYRNAAERVATQLDTLGYEFEWQTFPGEHNKDYWENQLTRSLLWYSQNW